MATRDRRSVELPAQLVTDVSAIARRRGHMLSALVAAAIANATKAAERGQYASLPERLRVPDVEGAKPKQRPVKYSVSDADAERSLAALQGAGSSVRVVVLRFFEAYRDADGSLFDVVAPGDLGAVYRHAGAA